VCHSIFKLFITFARPDQNRCRMNNFTDVYDTREQYNSSQNSLRYFFISQGAKTIFKAVDYSYVGYFNGLVLFNFAFGDYDPVTGEISDDDVSGNGDQYKVFHTVLGTVPKMFDTLGDVSLMVQGSDSKPEFIAQCKAACTRKCGGGPCKKAHRRITVYRGFVDKHLDELQKSYLFSGAEVVDNQNIIE
jgi:hypothetical protein